MLGENSEAIEFYNTIRDSNETEESSASYRWALGRLALAVGDTTSAKYILEPLKEVAAQNSFVYLDLLQTMTTPQAIEFDRTVASVEELKAISDTMALAYMIQGGSQAFERALVLRPEDLYIHYKLMNASSPKDNYEIYREHVESLRYFTTASLDATHPELFQYIATTIPMLVVNNIWDADTAQAAASYLVWRHHTSQYIETMLRTLRTTYPNQPAWAFLMGELYERNGNLEQAIQQYSVALKLDNTYWPVLRQINFLLQKHGCMTFNDFTLSQMQSWYENSLTIATNNILAMRALLEISKCRSSASIGVGDKNFAESLHNELYLAEALQIDEKKIHLGPNLIVNGDFSKWNGDIPASFTYMEYSGVSGIEGEFSRGTRFSRRKFCQNLNTKIHSVSRRRPSLRGICQ